MPTWGQILHEINTGIQKGDGAPFDTVRKKYLKELSEYTGRETILYASKWTAGDIPPTFISINDEDIQAFMEAMYGLKGKSLDLILHTGGGSAESTEAIVSYIRQKFPNDVRVIVPQAAMSAGTMLACSANEIVMAKHSSLGPIDPQMILQTPIGIQAVPAHSIMEQFKKAQEEIKGNPQLLNSWLPMLSQYGPALLVRCQNQIEFGQKLVETWLDSYMFKEDEKKLGSEISTYLSGHDNFKTHSKHINAVEAKKLGLKILDLESDPTFQDKVLSVFHAAMLTFNTAAVKLICNHLGNTFVKQQQQVPIQIPMSRPSRPTGQ